MENFRKIADEIMSDINVSEELKRKTLERCTRRKVIPISKVLVPAACFLLIFSIVNFSGILQNKPLTNGNGDMQTEGIVTVRTAEGMESFPSQTGNDAIIDMYAVREWDIETLEEARDRFGDAFLKPSYIPGNYKLDRIRVSGPDENIADKVVLSYHDGDRSFSIIEEKDSVQQELTGYKTVDINGVTGYVRVLPYDMGVNKEASGIEIHWFKEGVHYSITGLLTEDEAIKTASSMDNN